MYIKIIILNALRICRQHHPHPMPTIYPTNLPSIEPSIEPSSNPTLNPTLYPSLKPTYIPAILPYPTSSTPPTYVPTIKPFATITPTVMGSGLNTIMPSVSYTIEPTKQPNKINTMFPANSSFIVSTYKSRHTNYNIVLLYTFLIFLSSSALFYAIYYYIKTEHKKWEINIAENGLSEIHRTNQENRNRFNVGDKVMVLRKPYKVPHRANIKGADTTVNKHISQM